MQSTVLVALVALLALCAAVHLDSLGVSRDSPPVKRGPVGLPPGACAGGTLVYNVQNGNGYSAPIVFYPNGTAITDVWPCDAAPVVSARLTACSIPFLGSRQAGLSRGPIPAALASCTSVSTLAAPRTPQ